MTTKRPWMPLYIADYLKDTTHLGALESGAYIHLIMDYWQNGELPSDDRLLARIAKMTPTEWKRSRSVMQNLFQDGWKHKRIDIELAKTEQISSKRSAAATARQDAIRKQTECKSTANTIAKPDTLHTSHFTPPLGEEENPAAKVISMGLGSPIDPAFQPNAEAIQRARDQGATDEDIDREIRKFIAHYQISEGRSPNWQASWAKWWENWKPHKERITTKAKASPRIEYNVEPDWDAACKRFVANRGWPRNHGGEPGMVSCRCPPEIQRKHGIDHATGLKLREGAS